MPTETQREGSGIDGRAIAVAALAVLLAIVMVTALVKLLSALNQTSIQPTRRALQAPALSDPDPVDLLHSYQAAQAAKLNGYGWEDPAHSYAHIPIERAMQLLSQHPAPPQPARSPPPRQRARQRRVDELGERVLRDEAARQAGGGAAARLHARRHGDGRASHSTDCRARRGGLAAAPRRGGAPAAAIQRRPGPRGVLVALLQAAPTRRARADVPLLFASVSRDAVADAAGDDACGPRARP